MSAQTDSFTAYLERGDIKYDLDDDRGLFRMLFDGKHGEIRVMIIVEDAMIQVFTHPANKIPEGYRTQIAEAVTRANYGLKLGKFEMDLDDGEIRYQTALPLGDSFPCDEVLDHILYVGGAMVDRYVPAFLSIVYGNEDVKLAIDAAEL
ncbi:Putative sensory transduction regulator [Neorhodopirellula lusitana]|uniref:Sensory transduction regulator n=1 Tax=Neorhodopirellula lusitana TaxID=445327 RepID=A0ABY1QPR2_9BACT|nr:YbjN domain-containing protein [Neorhodopirellula lusitana]SMP77506.1 Putative sensory transduction regulator [Neorhodopirellula lusitana]